MKTPTKILMLVAAACVPLHAYGQGTPDIPPAPPPAPEPKPQPRPKPKAEPAPEPEAKPPPEAPPPRKPEAKPAAGVAATDAGGARPAEKDREKEPSGRQVVSPTGETGLFRIASAETVDPGLVRLSLGIDFFKVGSFIEPDDGHAMVGGTLAISGSPIRYLELWLATRFQSNQNNLTTPQLLQSQGDLTLGVKGYYPIADLATVGLDLQLSFLNGIGSASFDFGATAFHVRALLTSDLYKATEKVPVRLHLNLGFLLDNSGNLIEDGAALTNAERYALGISDFNRVTLGLGVEVPVKYVTPFIEYSVEFPISYLATPGIVITGNGLSPNQTPAPPVADTIARPAYQRVVPQRITPGVRITAIPDLTLDLVVEIGITPDVGTGVLAVPPYRVGFLASYPIDPFATSEPERGPPITVPVIVPEAVAPPPSTGSIGGLVKNKADGAPLEGAIVGFDRSSPVATGSDGRFISQDLEPGPVTVTVRREGFQAGTASLEVAVGETAELDVELVPSIKEGSIRGRVVDEKDKPLAGIEVSVDGPTKGSPVTDEAGQFTLAAREGRYTITVEHEGFLKKSRVHDLKGGETFSADFLIRKPPKVKLVEIKGNRILVKESVHFITGEARLAPDAAALLDNVVDVLVEKSSIRVRVEGHTDNVGGDDVNLQLSKDRAQSVVQYLTEQGINPDRLTAEGFGAARPIAPNLTRRGREQNRRVEFHIVEQ
jgi:outer membrane protein OmpA-like peptidoglycan-associated protein